MLGIHLVGALVCHSVWPLLYTSAMFLFFAKKSFVLLAIVSDELSLSISHTIHPLANIDTTLSLDDPSLAIGFVVPPAAFIQ